jgi:hypothetical protein
MLLDLVVGGAYQRKQPRQRPLGHNLRFVVVVDGQVPQRSARLLLNKLAAPSTSVSICTVVLVKQVNFVPAGAQHSDERRERTLLHSFYYSVYLLYKYKSTNTDSGGGAAHTHAHLHNLDVVLSIDGNVSDSDSSLLLDRVERRAQQRDQRRQTPLLHDFDCHPALQVSVFVLLYQ